MKETTRLEKLLTKQFIYKQDNITIKDYFLKDEDKTVHIITDKKPIVIKEADIAKFCEQLLPVEEPTTRAVAQVAISTEVVQQTTGLLSTLQQTLLDNIERVKTDKEYIKQANVVNSSVNALIGMTKLQISVAKLNSQKQ